MTFCLIPVCQVISARRKKLVFPLCHKIAVIWLPTCSVCIFSAAVNALNVPRRLVDSAVYPRWALILVVVFVLGDRQLYPLTARWWWWSHWWSRCLRKTTRHSDTSSHSLHRYSRCDAIPTNDLPEAAHTIICVFVFRYQPAVKWTRWPTATWLWCLVPTCSGDKTTPCHSAPSGQSTTSPEACWTSSIWSFLKSPSPPPPHHHHHPPQYIFRCKMPHRTWHLAQSWFGPFAVSLLP